MFQSFSKFVRLYSVSSTPKITTHYTIHPREQDSRWKGKAMQRICSILITTNHYGSVRLVRAPWGMLEIKAKTMWLIFPAFLQTTNHSWGCRGRDRMVVGFTTTYQCLSPLMLWVRIAIRARCTTLCANVCRWLATGRWFSPGPRVYSTNKTDRHDITEILLKVALNTITQTNK